MDNKKKERTLISVYRGFVLAPFIFVTAIVAVSVSLIYSFVLSNERGYIIALTVVLVLSLAAYVIFYVRLIRKMHHTFYDQMFSITYGNIRKIRNNDVNLSSYKDTNIKEINMLNESTREIKEKLKSAYLITREPDYSNLSLEYIDKEKNLITYNSFKSNLRNIIFVSQSYRNVIVEVYFNLPPAFSLSDEDLIRLLNIYRETFKEHSNVLYMFGEDDRSLLIYIPVIDSFSEIKEKLEFVVNKSSIMIRDDRGVRNIPAQYALVAYPYSTEDVLLGDLRYARRQNKPYLLYLPNRVKNNTNQIVMTNSSMNLNYMSKMIGELSQLDYFSLDKEKNVKVLKGALEAVCNYMNIDEAGIISFDEADDKYSLYTYADKSTLFVGGEVERPFVEALTNAADDDNMYYFSNRSHANYALRREIDLRGITSGVYYVIKSTRTNRVMQIIYFFNRGKDLALNSYLRESFFMMALRIENFFEKKGIADYADDKNDENENILALSNLYVYRVDNDYHILRASKNMRKVFPHAKEGELCYKAFFGTDKPCKDCPLRNFKKKYFTNAAGIKYESSLTLNDRKTTYSTLVVKNVENDLDSGDLFQNNLLVYSFKSLVDELKNEYHASSRGYVVLLRIDNYDQLVGDRGSEAYDFIIRNYVRNIKNKLNVDDIYYYNPTTLALHLPNRGHADVINVIESIYSLSKENCFRGDENTKLNVSYLPVGYPRGYAHAEDFLRHMSEFYRDPRLERNKDFIYFADFSISRSASKHDFIVSVLRDEFSSQSSTSVNLQPILRAADGHIFGAEILLRINDAHRNVFFNAAEISRIAEEENMTHLITESTINFVGNLYKEYGKGIFKTNNFNRIAINIDQTYLKDQTLVTNLIKLSEENNLPNNFVSLEIPEDMIAHNFEGVRELANKLKGHKTLLSCDRYLGEYVDVEQLKELGIGEIKIARDLILKIDKDPLALQSLTAMVNSAKEKDIKVAAVGVENEQQYRLLKSLDEEMMVQGYFFYKPLTRSDFIAALVSYEK